MPVRRPARCSQPGSPWPPQAPGPPSCSGSRRCRYAAGTPMRSPRPRCRPPCRPRYRSRRQAPSPWPPPRRPGPRGTVTPPCGGPLGPDVTASIVDAASGDVLLARRQPAQQPASTLKTLTAVTALRALGTDKRLRTTVVAASRTSDLVLVGGGDATLTRTPRRPRRPTGQAARPASLTELGHADRGRAALLRHHDGDARRRRLAVHRAAARAGLAEHLRHQRRGLAGLGPVRRLRQGLGDLAGARRRPRPGGRPLLRRPARGRRDHGHRIRHASYGARHGHRGRRGPEPDDGRARRAHADDVRQRPRRGAGPLWPARPPARAAASRAARPRSPRRSRRWASRRRARGSSTAAGCRGSTSCPPAPSPAP